MTATTNRTRPAPGLERLKVVRHPAPSYTEKDVEAYFWRLSALATICEYMPQAPDDRVLANLPEVVDRRVWRLMSEISSDYRAVPDWLKPKSPRHRGRFILTVTSPDDHLRHWLSWLYVLAASFSGLLPPPDKATFDAIDVDASWGKALRQEVATMSAAYAVLPDCFKPELRDPKDLWWMDEDGRPMQHGSEKRRPTKAERACTSRAERATCRVPTPIPGTDGARP